MKIKEGVNGKETEIRVCSGKDSGIQLWIQESGKDNKETLLYMTVNELFELFKEVKKAGRNLFEGI